jgi:hypothetical protein
MQVRVEPSEAFPQRVCEVSVPPAAHVEIGSVILPTAPVAPRKIIVIGDTGCRIKKLGDNSTLVQDCKNTDSGWPFAKVAAAASKLNPDLIIHVGDYHYRESACPAGNAQCKGSPYGDKAAVWNEDFFKPAAPLLAAAPWIFVRGNHEDCKRAHEGFFRFLDPYAFSPKCESTSAPYAVQFANLSLVVLDSSNNDITSDNLKTVSNLPVKGAWLLTHRPPWLSKAAKAAKDSDGDDDDNVADSDQDERSVASSETLAVGFPKNLGMVLAGHQHIFRATTFADHRPPQIIAGNGGTMLDTDPAAETKGTAMDAGSTNLEAVATFQDFGFLLFEQDGAHSWTAKMYDRSGNPRVICRAHDKDKHKHVMDLQCDNPTQAM